MAEESDFSRILQAFDNYVKFLENPHVGAKLDVGNIAKIFDCCRFVEAAIAKVCREDKSQCFESHLRARWAQQNRTINYPISHFEKACDKILEVFMKDSSIPTPVIDKLLQLYTQHCGSERLNDLLSTLLMVSMCANAIVNSVIKQGVPAAAIEDEALLLTWEIEAGQGKLREVSLCVKEMLRDNQVPKIARFAARLDEASPLRKLIMENLTSEASECKPIFFATLADMERKLLYKLLRDDEFHKYFLDGVFYFGRNMQRRDEAWHAEHEFTYERLVRTMKNLMIAREEISEVTNYRLEDAKELDADGVWTDVERDALS